MSPLTPPPPETIAWLRDLAERRLSAGEFNAALAVPVDEFERDEMISLIDWFCRRYPTPAERLAYVRRAYRRWTAAATTRAEDPTER